MSTTETIEQSVRLLRFFHPEKRFDFLSGSNDIDALAKLFGLSKEEYVGIHKDFLINVEKCAKELLDDQDFINKILEIPLEKNDVLAVIGDSLSDDCQSWFEIMKSVFKLALPKLNLQWRNVALSGDTSMQLFSPLTKIKNIQPDYLFCLIGTNDARIHGNMEKHCTDLPEIEKNLDAISHESKKYTRKKFIWITPVGVLENRISKDWLLKKMNARWDNQQILDTSKLILERPEDCIDIQEIFRGENRNDMFLDDGLHWSLEGQKCVAKKVIDDFYKFITL